MSNEVELNKPQAKLRVQKYEKLSRVFPWRTDTRGNGKVRDEAYQP